MWVFLLLIGFGTGYAWRAIRHECPYCRLWPGRHCPHCGQPL